MLTPQEANELFAIVKSLQADGKSIIFISHKLNEVLEIADRITRPAPRQEDRDRAARRRDRGVARARDGRPRGAAARRQAAGEAGRGRCSTVEDLHVLDDRGIEKVRGVSFDVRAGEIVGIAGVDGNGQTELIDAITGLRQRRTRARSASRAGRRARERPRRCSTPASATFPRTGSGAGSCSSSRSPRTSRCTTTPKPPNARWGWLFPQRLVERATALIKEFDVRGGGPLTRAGGLSGGNQQKVVAAREIARDPKVLIAAQPTRGLDVGAIEYLHRRLVEERDEGRAVLLVSLELDEMLSLSDRILVIYEGEIVGEHTRDVSEEQIGLEMLGGRRDGGGVSDDPAPPPPPDAGPAAADAASRRTTLASRLALKQRAGGIACRWSRPWSRS